MARRTDGPGRHRPLSKESGSASTNPSPRTTLVSRPSPPFEAGPETSRLGFTFEDGRSSPDNDPGLSGEGRIGDPTVTADELSQMGNLVATRHLLTLLAKRRSDVSRDGAIDEVAALLLDLNDGPYARRLILQMAEVGRIVDIYPLEVMVRIMEQAPTAIPRTTFGPVILNAPDIEAKPWAVEEVIPLKVPLNMRLKAFALQGGGTPGYALAPGPPARYALEFGAPGTFTLLFRGEVRRDAKIDRLTVRVADAPTSPAR